MVNKNIILIGGGGHCKSCIEVIEAASNYRILGIIDSKGKMDGIRHNLIGDDSSIPLYAKSKENFFLVSVGQIKSASLRKTLFNYVVKVDAALATVISPFAIVSQQATIKAGSIVFHHAVVNADSRIGYNAILNTKSLVEHDCIIGDHCHVSTGAIINGGCTVGDGVLIGSNSVVIQGINIVSNVIIGAGSIVAKSITTPGTYVGNPAKKISDNIG